jgi:hypothetical protein
MRERVQQMQQQMRQRVQQMRTATDALPGATNASARRMRLREQQMLNRGCANCASGRGVRVTQIRSGGGREHYQELITCWEMGWSSGKPAKRVYCRSE